VLLLAVVALAVIAAPASARWYGSTLHGKPNAKYGCKKALINGLYGPVMSPTNQRSCTYRHGGYLYRNRRTFLVPGTGRVTRIRIKTGPHPAKARLTVLTGSSRVDPFSGQDQPGTYTCCTAHYVSRPFRLRPNRINKKRVNVKVYSDRSTEGGNDIHYTDGLALSFGSRGRVPLRITNKLGSYDAGTPLLTGYWPRTGKGDPRVDGYPMQGIDLMFQFNWKRKRR
jgi:hypothetical protein